MHFEQVLTSVKCNLRIRRPGWPHGDWVGMHRPCPKAHITRPYLFRATAQGVVAPWCPTQEDIFASDWSVAS